MRRRRILNIQNSRMTRNTVWNVGFKTTSAMLSMASVSELERNLPKCLWRPSEARVGSIHLPSSAMLTIEKNNAITPLMTDEAT